MGQSGGPGGAVRQGQLGLGHLSLLLSHLFLSHCLCLFP